MIAGIVLAAGQGSRLGQPKAWLQALDPDETFFGRACRVLAGAGTDAVIGVIAPGDETVAGRSAPGARQVINPDPGRGQLSSLQAGLAALDVECEAALVLPVDVPGVSPRTVRALIDHWRASSAPVVRPVAADGRHGHPVILARAIFEDLLRVPVSDTAKGVVRAHASPAGDLPIDDEGAFSDVDTAEDYVRMFGRLPARAKVR